MFYILLLLLLNIYTVFANTEKVVFLGPSNLQIPVEHPTLQDLQLESLSPQHWSLRTHIEAEFPSDISKYGHSSWLLLHRLQEGKRYEVRICWAATQPTIFRLETYDIPRVFETPDLITSLAQYSESHQQDTIQIEDHKPSISEAYEKSKLTYDDVSSLLFLRIHAVADYYTRNETLMKHVPPVFVDIILDPYVFNVFPRSLVPTAAYIIILAIGGWYLAKYISESVKDFSKYDFDMEKKIT